MAIEREKTLSLSPFAYMSDEMTRPFPPFCFEPVSSTSISENNMQNMRIPSSTSIYSPAEHVSWHEYASEVHNSILQVSDDAFISDQVQCIFSSEMN